MKCDNCDNLQSLGNYCCHCGFPLGTTVGMSHKATYTLQDIYDSWSKQHFMRIALKTVEEYKIAWGKMQHISNVAFLSIKTNKMQIIMDREANLGKSYSSVQGIKKLYSQLCKFAIAEDIVSANYAEFLKNYGYHSKEKKPFSDNDISALYKCANNHASIHSDSAKIALIFILTGFRINELFNITKERMSLQGHYFISGSKTAAGKDRYVPIPDIVFPFVQYFWLKNIVSNPVNKYLFTDIKGEKLNANYYR